MQRIEQVEWLSPGDLIPYEMNAKAHPAEQVEHIANSIKNHFTSHKKQQAKSHPMVNRRDKVFECDTKQGSKKWKSTLKQGKN